MSLINVVLQKIDFSVFQANSENSGDYLVVDFRIGRFWFHIGLRTPNQGGNLIGPSHIEEFETGKF